MEKGNWWYQQAALAGDINFKEDKAVIKLRHPDNTFKGSVIIPTSYYPLNGKYEVFTSEKCEEVTDKAVLDIFDKIKYRVGQCYTNTEELVNELIKAGYDAKSYVGWLFTEAGEYPVHHCWVVLNGKSVLDLGDDFCAMLSGENGKHFKEAQNIEEMRELIASFVATAKKWPNSHRCMPVGQPTPFLLYIGCPCDPDEGVAIYQRLMKQYPDHECQRNVDNEGYNATQRKMRDMGVID